jgi:16S rRNA (cytosine967-C5)-methyltransferase
MSKRMRKCAAVPTARSVAAEVLIRVLRDQAFAAAVLDAELGRAAQLDARDRRFATELVYGVLRCRGWLQQRVAQSTSRGLDGQDTATLAHLLIAAYQLLVLERVPSFAAVSQAVALIRSSRGEGLARFANAVLRRLAADSLATGRVPIEHAMGQSVQPELMDRLAHSLGSREQATAFATQGPWPPPVCVRVKQGQDREVWQRRLAEAAPHARVLPGRISPMALTVQGSGPVARLPGFLSCWVPQEEGSQFIGLSVGAREGERVLDACAGRGNKTLLLAERVGNTGQVHAADRHPSKLAILREALGSSGVTAAGIFAVDWTLGPGEVGDGYDRVLVDAPCSGVGTLRRRPELLARDIGPCVAEMQPLQIAILVAAASRCRPGGRIVYSVCSVLREEAEDVVRAATERSGGLSLVPFDSECARGVAGDAPTLRLLPSVHGTDGYFVASFLRDG